jgi:hypothetical protein
MRVLARNAILKEIAKEDPDSIFQAMLDADRVEHDSMKEEAIQSVLSQVMRQRTLPPEFFTQIKTYIADSANSNFQRGMVIGLLALAATKESTDLLIYEATNQKDKELREESIHAIGGLGGRSPDESPAPALERVWGESHDQELLSYVGQAMAGIGKSSSLQILVDAAFGPQDKDNRKGMAFAAMEDIHSPNAVPPLAVAFNKAEPNTLEFQMIGDTLVTIGDATAAQALLTRLENVDDNDATQVRTWIQNAQTPAMRKGFAAALDPKVPFHNEAVRDAIRAGVATYQRKQLPANP